MKRVVLGMGCLAAVCACAVVFPKIKVPEFESKTAAVPSDPIIGTAAPEAELKLIDGTAVMLSSHQGRDVVVLDFWASWCGPCRRALPHMEALAQEYAQTNVVFYAVNLGEDEAAVRTALEELGVTMPVALDADGSMAASFEVSGIPHSVIIDLEGRIWTFHSGFSSGMEDMLRAEIGMVLAGVAPIVTEGDSNAVAEPAGYQAQPLPTGEAVHLWLDQEPLWKSAWTRIFTEVLDACPVQGGVSKEELAEFLTGFAEQHAVESLKQKRLIDYRINKGLYRKTAEKLDAYFAVGADHPSLRCADVLCARVVKDNDRRLAAAKAGLAALDAAGADFPWMRFEFLEELTRFDKPVKQRAEWRGQAMDSFVQSFHTEYWEDEEVTAIVRRFINKYWSFFKKGEQRRALSDQMMADELVPRYIAGLADGFTHSDEAWDARGNSWGHKVSEEGWMGFAEHLAAARESLVMAYEARPSLPDAATRMIMVSMGECAAGNEERMWFDRAVAARFDFSAAYSQLAWALTPRWGGSIEALQSVGDEILATERYDTLVPSEYFTYSKYIMLDSGLQPVNFRTEAERDRQIGILRGYKQAGSMDKNSLAAAATHAAAGLSLGGHHAEAYETLKAIDFKINKKFNTNRMGVRVWKNYRISAVLEGGPIAEQYQAMEQLAEAGNYAEAAEAIDGMLSDPSLTVHAKERLLLMRETFRMETLPANEWISIFAQGDDAPWVIDGGYWAKDGDGFLKIVGDDMGLGWIPGAVSLKDRFELEYTVERIPGSKKPRNERTVLFFCNPEWHQYMPVRTALIYQKQQVLVSRGYNDDEKTVDCELPDGPSKVRIEVDRGRMSVFVNGEAVIQKHKMNTDGEYGDKLWIGLGDYWSGDFRSKYRFSDIRLKRLD